jgi:ABC-2 type transport system ATP-binding protein
MIEKASVMIEVSEVNKTYRAFDIDRKEIGIGLWVKNIRRLTANRASTVCALSNASFSVDRGEILGIFGANGAGKTTLVRLMSGLLQPDSGTITVDGCADLRRIKNKVSYVSTNGWMGLEWQLTAGENLRLYGDIFGIDGRRLEGRADRALQLLGMSDLRSKRVSELSAGMRQKLTLARGLILERPVLYLDEPTVSLDVAAAAAVRDIARSYVAAGDRSVLVTSHNPADLSICDRILFLHRGKVLALGAVAELGRPLAGITTLHILYAGDEAGGDGANLRAELRDQRGVHSVVIDRANGRRDHWRARIGIHQSQNPTGEIIDCFIRHGLQIVALHMTPITLQELYDHYCAEAYASPEE